jgi:hypothetical protein
LREVYAVEARCKERKLSADQRLAEHRERSAPVMKQLHAFMTTELENKRVEPNSGLGKAYEYMLKRWDKLTLFLRERGAPPLENNICYAAHRIGPAIPPPGLCRVGTANRVEHRGIADSERPSVGIVIGSRETRAGGQTV